jgi:hypothetical protein
MSDRPSELADRISGRLPSKTFRLPLEAARQKAREIINQMPQDDYVAYVEGWRQLSDGQIEFSVRRQRTVQQR